MRNKVYNLETEHKQRITHFKKQTEHKNKLNAEKVRLQLEIENIKDKKRKLQKQERLAELKSQIENITVDKDKRDYFKQTSKLLYDYYVDSNVENIDMDTKDKPGSLGNIISVVSSSNKSEIFDKYMSTLYSDHEINVNMMQNKERTCDCGNELTTKRSEGELVCMGCGQSYDDIIDSEKRAYKNVPPDVTYFAYKRMNHLNELLAQFQGKENTNITLDTYELIRDELKKRRFYDYDKLTPLMIRKILKKLKLTHYYDHVPHIIHKLNGKPILTINHETEQKIRGMFTQLQEPFVECRPKNRHNFLNYSYTLYKIFELLGLDEFLHCFVLFKNSEKLYIHDCIWKCICSKLQWEFLKTI